MKHGEEVLVKYAERMHRKSKKEFREFLKDVAEETNFPSKVDSNFFAKNVVVGDPIKAKYIITAHYDTPPRLPKFFVKHMLINSFITLPLLVLAISLLLPMGLLKIPFFLNHANITAVVQQVLTWASVGLPVGYLFGFLGGANKHNSNDNSSGVLALVNMMEKLKDAPKEVKDQYCFVFTDNEEKGLLGGFSFAHKYKKHLEDKTFINMDCVGVGEQIMGYYASKEPTKIVKDLEKLSNKGFVFRPKKSNMLSMSDHIAFSKYNHVTLLNVDKVNNNSLYSQIHSSNDTRCDENNIDYLTSACIEITREQSTDKQKTKELEKSNLLTRQVFRSKTNNNKKVSSIVPGNYNDKVDGNTL